MENVLHKRTTSEDTWPAVNDAFAFVVPSYQMLLARFEAADSRLTSFITMVTTVTLAAPVFLKSVRTDLRFTSPWFMIAMGCFLAVVGLGIWGRLHGRLVLPNPRVLYNESLSESPWEFRKNALYYAGQHFERNAAVIDFKGRLTVYLTVVFAL